MQFLNPQFPNGFIESLNGLPGFDEQSFIQCHTTGIPVPVSVRLNRNKNWEGKDEWLNNQPVPWCTDGVYLEERPSFTIDPVFHAGGYYVQEASSMFLNHVLNQIGADQPGLLVLDLCAAPGGKSTLIQSVIDSSSLLVSNEIIKSRVSILKENITKWGGMNVVITQNDPNDFVGLEGLFDILVVDAPCSGSGLFRKDPAAMDHWSEDQVTHCSLRQKRILESAMACLKQGGYLIYSTCSYSKEEDESIAEWLCTKGFEAVQIPVDPLWGVVETKTTGCYGYRFYPNRLKGEGFFLSVVQKQRPAQKHINRTKKIKKAGSEQIRRWSDKIKNNGVGYSILDHQGHWYAVPERQLGIIEILLSHLYVKQAGTPVGEWVRDDFVPSHALALSQHLQPLYPVIELEMEDALKYLRKEHVDLTGTMGWNLIRYRKLRLGWVKVLMNRINNYYPGDWRILNK